MPTPSPSDSLSRASQWALGLLLVLVACGLYVASLAGYLWSSAHEPMHLESVYKDYSYDADKAEDGRYLFSLGCARCHLDRAGTLGPREYVAVPGWFGRVQLPNLSRDPLFGNSEWTDEDLWRVMAHDVGRLGLRVPGTMPSFRQLDEDDIERIVAFLRLDSQTARPVTVASVPSQYAIGGILASLFLKTRDSTVRTPSIRGQYLADVVMGCGQCHSSRVSRLSANFDYTGSDTNWSAVGVWMSAPSLRGRSSIMGGYEPEDLERLLRTGQTPDGYVVEMPLYPDVETADVRAVWAYLDSLDGRIGERGASAPALAGARIRGLAATDCRGCHNPAPALGTAAYREAHSAERIPGSYYSYHSPLFPLDAAP